MALITGIPNFFNAAGPVAADFNNAAKAIATQVGGNYFDEGLTSLVSAAGNLDTANISSTAALRNSQKAESNGLFIMSGYSNTTAITATFPDTIILGMAESPCQAVGLAISAGRNTGTGVVGGYVNLYLNNVLFTAVTFSQSTSTTANSSEFSYSAISSLFLNPGDFVYLDFSFLNPFGAKSGGTVPTTTLQAALLLKAAHIR